MRSGASCFIGRAQLLKTLRLAALRMPQSAFVGLPFRLLSFCLLIGLELRIHRQSLELRLAFSGSHSGRASNLPALACGHTSPLACLFLSTLPKACDSVRCFVFVALPSVCSVDQLAALQQGMGIVAQLARTLLAVGCEAGLLAFALVLLYNNFTLKIK